MIAPMSSSPASDPAIATAPPVPEPAAPPQRPAWPPIPLGAAQVTVGRTEANDVPIQHASISRTHLRVGRLPDGHYELEDLNSRFGTFVNGARIKKVLLKPGDTVRIGSSPPYRFNAQGGALEVSLDGAGMAINLRDLSIVRDDRTLIQNINLSIPADSFVGVLGPSGAGKSLMLGTLSSTMAPTTGTVEFDDGHPVKDNLEYYRGKIGIVTQDDIVYNDLTVQENLCFAAEIRLPDLPHAERGKRVDFALEAVGLTEHRAKRVGVLSGGQRKRVSVAIELLLQPRLLLLDEPTSGLDPGMQARLMEMLRGLSRKGVTVVCTTHTLDTLNFFDQLLVLGLKDRVASVAYFGSPRELLPSFGVHTQMDLFDKLQTLSGQTPAERAAAEQEEDELPASVSITRRRRALRPRAQVRLAKTPDGGERVPKQVKVVYRRAMLGLLRDRMAVFMALVQPPILAVLTALAGINQPKSIALSFFVVVCAMWLGMTLTVREVVRERKLYIRDRLAGMRPIAYLLGKVAFAATIVLFQATVLWVMIKILSTTFVRNQNTAEAVARMGWVSGWVALMLTGLGAAVIGLIVSTISKSERAAVGFLPLILLPQVVLSRPLTAEAKRDWPDPSPYMPMSHHLTGAPMVGLTKFEHQQYQMMKFLWDYRVQLRLSGAESRLAEAGLYIPKDEPRPPEQGQARGGMGRVLNFAISAPMLTRPATAAIDMLGERPAPEGSTVPHITTWTVVVEYAYLIFLIAVYSAVLYALFMMLEKGWNDVRTAG